MMRQVRIEGVRMSPQQQERTPFPPLPPTEPVQEGARWRWHRPDSAAVATWFNQQPLDEQMRHEHYIGGVVLIPQSEKVKYTNPDGQGTTERFEQVFTPYVQIGTRIAYFRRLGELRNLIPVIAPAEVPRAKNPDSVYFNGNMEEGLWWHVVASGQGGHSRFLCATWTVALYEKVSYAKRLNGETAMPMLQGRGTKQVGGGSDINQIAKAQTGAIGRALGVAGILVIGTGVASAEDMQEFAGPPAQAVPGEPQLPSPPETAAGEPPVPRSDEEALDQLRSRATALQEQLQSVAPTKWREFAAWYRERAQESGWAVLDDAPLDALRGIVSRMERMLAEAQAVPNAETQVAPQGGASA